MLAADIEVHPERNRNQENEHRSGNDLELRTLDEREAEHDKETDATDEGNDWIHFHEIARYRCEPFQRGPLALDTKHYRNLSRDDEYTD